MNFKICGVLTRVLYFPLFLLRIDTSNHTLIDFAWSWSIQMEKNPIIIIVKKK